MSKHDWTRSETCAKCGIARSQDAGYCMIALQPEPAKHCWYCIRGYPCRHRKSSLQPEPECKCLKGDIDDGIHNADCPKVIGCGKCIDGEPCMDKCIKNGDILKGSQSYIESKQDVMGGAPVIKGTRIDVKTVKARLAGGETIQDLIEDYPEISAEAFEAALGFTQAKPIDTMTEDIVNYIEQAQIILAESDRKGASILHGMGKRLLDRMKSDDE